MIIMGYYVQNMLSKVYLVLSSMYCTASIIAAGVSLVNTNAKFPMTALISKTPLILLLSLLLLLLWVYHCNS